MKENKKDFKTTLYLCLIILPILMCVISYVYVTINPPQKVLYGDTSTRLLQIVLPIIIYGLSSILIIKSLNKKREELKNDGIENVLNDISKIRKKYKNITRVVTGLYAVFAIISIISETSNLYSTITSRGGFFSAQSVSTLSIFFLVFAIIINLSFRASIKKSKNLNENKKKLAIYYYCDISLPLFFTGTLETIVSIVLKLIINVA